MLNPVALVAHKEFIDGFRHRWVVFASLSFALLSLAVAFLGSAVSGQLSTPELAPTISALATLAALVIPLLAVLLGHDSFVGELEGGTLLLLLSYPISRWQLLFGKFLGQGAVLATTCLIGFGVTAVALGFVVGTDQLLELTAAFALFIFSSALLACTFLLVSYLVSLAVSTKGRAMAICLLLWFVLVLLYDLVLLGLIVAEGSESWVRALMMANPVDLFRLSNLVYVEHQSVSGVLSLVTSQNSNLWLMLLLMFAWSAAGLFAGWQIFKRKRV